MSERKRWQRVLDVAIGASIALQIVVLAAHYGAWAGLMCTSLAFNGFMLGRPWR